MRIPSKPNPENSAFRPILVCDALARHGHLAIWCGYVLANDCVAALFRAAARTKTALFIALSGVPRESPLFEHTSISS
jgi:hypothetical protein